MLLDLLTDDDIFNSVSSWGTNYINVLNGPYSGDWTTVTSITGSDSHASASIQNIVVPSYVSGSKVIWGGKVWANKTGNLGNNGMGDSFNLNSDDWEVISYNDVDYNIIWDEIEYDVVNNFITMRRDAANNIVKQSYWNYYSIDNYYRAISLFQWGNEAVYYIGFGNNVIDDSYVNLINFRGKLVDNNTFENYAFFDYNVFELYSKIINNNFNDCGIYGNFFGGNIYDYV